MLFFAAAVRYQLPNDDDGLEILFTRQFQMPTQFPQKLLEHFGAARVKFIKAKNGDGLRLENVPQQPPLEFARQVLTFLSQLLAK